MTRAERIEKARALFSGPYNCSQSVAMAFSDMLGMKEEDILRAMSGFGFGMGGERSVCGSVSGGIFVLSALGKNPADRDETYMKVLALVTAFKDHNHGMLNCLDLVGENPTETEFSKTCPLLIEQVVDIVARILED